MWSATGRRARPGLRPGGWPFEYRNDHYPDVDDTAVILCALHRADPERYRAAIERGVEWMLGMQSRNGGWGVVRCRQHPLTTSTTSRSPTTARCSTRRPPT